MESKIVKDDEAIKNSCCNFYESDLLDLFLGKTLHPGGEKLTDRLGEILKIDKGSSLMDMASGKGVSGIRLAKKFGCLVTGVDISPKNVMLSNKLAEEEGLLGSVKFLRSDAEHIELASSQFDFVISECALCTFPNKNVALEEACRLLRYGGSIAIAEINLEDGLNEEYNTIAYNVACIAGALSKDGYVSLLREHGFSDVVFEDHSDSINTITDKLRTLVDGWELLGGLSKEISNISSLTPAKARAILDKLSVEVEKGLLGYGIYSARKC